MKKKNDEVQFSTMRLLKCKDNEQEGEWIIACQIGVFEL